jgi:hypothetical protein
MLCALSKEDLPWPGNHCLKPSNDADPLMLKWNEEGARVGAGRHHLL